MHLLIDVRIESESIEQTICDSVLLNKAAYQQLESNLYIDM